MTTIMKCISPIDNSVLFERKLADSKAIEQVLKKSESAQHHWSQLSLSKRQSFIHKALDLMVMQKEEIGKEITLQIGRPINAAPGEIMGVDERGRYMINIADRALQTYFPGSNSSIERLVEKIPLGIIAVIAPWNYPYLTAINTIIPALVAGNSVILKHASQTLLCAERMHKIFLEAGIPEGVFQFLHLSHQNTEKLIQDHRIDFVSFTGSVPAGHQIRKTVSQRFIATGLELGGKDPAYVRADADLQQTVNNLVSGSFFNSGQSCCSIERIYVHSDIYKPFLQQFISETKQYRLGDPTLHKTTLGPMVNTKAAAFVRDQIKQAVSFGACCEIDASLFPMSQSDSPYLAPQVLTNVDHSMSVMNEESFGPVVGIMKVDSDQEAIHLMNDSDFGLTASIWTKEQGIAMDLGRKIKTGTVFMNRCDYVDPSLAWTGVKDTGHGYTLSLFGYNSITRLKNYHFRKIF